MHQERTTAPGALSWPARNAVLRSPRWASPRRVSCLAVWLALCLVLVVGCGRSQSAVTETQDDYQVVFATDPTPANQGEGTVLITIKDRQGQAVNAARVTIEGNMNHAGMKPENAEVTVGANGEYRLPINWTMGGAWYVDVTITLQNGEVVRRRFPVDVK